jgi:hypothetical protein
MTPCPSKTTKEYSLVVPEDTEQDFSQAVTLQMDERSVVEMIQYDDSGVTESYMVLTLQQASNLHMALGQLLVHHARSWGTKMMPHSLTDMSY